MPAAVDDPPAPRAVALDPAGADLPAGWAAVPGATAVEVSTAPLTVTARTREVVRTGVPMTAADGGYRLDLGADPVRTLGLSGLASDGTGLSSDADLVAAGLRVILAARSGDSWVPAFSAPASGLPDGVRGLSLAAGALALPDAALGTLLVTLTRSSSPPFAPEHVSLASVSATAVVRPRDVIATLAGSPVWSAPGVLTGTSRTDLAAHAQRALSAALPVGGTPLPLPAHLSSSVAADADVLWFGARGALVRAEPGPVTVTLTGDPLPLPLAALPAERPGVVTADLTLTYLDVRLSDTVDEHPSGTGPAQGQAVGAQPVVRTLPAAALLGSRPARIGLVGRAASDARLTVTLLDPTGAPLAPAATAAVPAGEQFGTTWLALPAAPLVTGPVAVSVRADTGTFLWLADPEPLVRVAVADADPGGHTVRIDGADLVGPGGTPLQCARPPAVVRGVALPANSFAGRTPVLDSRLFATVRLDHLTLRYPR